MVCGMDDLFDRVICFYEENITPIILTPVAVVCFTIMLTVLLPVAIPCWIFNKFKK
jgi:hypothetical protein